MAEQTTNLNLKKPEYSEAADVKDFNDNMDLIDAAVKQAQDDIDAIEARLPEGDGDQYDVLRSNGDGTSDWVAYGLPTDEQTAAAVTDWLDDHPDATTTVEDGAITRAKLNSDLQEKTDAVPALKSAIDDTDDVLEIASGMRPIHFTDGGYIKYESVGTVVSLTPVSSSATARQFSYATLWKSL